MSKKANPQRPQRPQRKKQPIPNVIPGINIAASVDADKEVRQVPYEIVSAIYDWEAANRVQNYYENSTQFTRKVVDQKWQNLMELIKLFGNS
jgi:hypothetical protein